MKDLTILFAGLCGDSSACGRVGCGSKVVV